MFLPFTDAQAWATLFIITLYWVMVIYSYRKDEPSVLQAVIRGFGYTLLLVIIGSGIAVMGGLVFHSIKSLIT